MLLPVIFKRALSPFALFEAMAHKLTIGHGASGLVRWRDPSAPISLDRGGPDGHYPRVAQPLLLALTPTLTHPTFEPRTKGLKQPSPHQVVARTKRQRLRWYGGATRQMEVVGEAAHWYKTGHGLVPLR
jgi:hypothetical protein